MSRQCYFCDEDGALDEHHIVPKRHGGSDKQENLVTVCPTCHRKLEQLYDNRFFDQIQDDTSALEAPDWWQMPVEHKNTPWTYGQWYTWICENEQEIRNRGGFTYETFHHTLIEKGKPISEDAAKQIWQRLRSNGAIHRSLPIQNEESLSTNPVWYDNVEEPPTADVEFVQITELMRRD